MTAWTVLHVIKQTYFQTSHTDVQSIWLDSLHISHYYRVPFLWRRWTEVMSSIITQYHNITISIDSAHTYIGRKLGPKSIRANIFELVDISSTKLRHFSPPLPEQVWKQNFKDKCGLIASSHPNELYNTINDFLKEQPLLLILNLNTSWQRLKMSNLIANILPPPLQLGNEVTVKYYSSK